MSEWRRRAMTAEEREAELAAALRSFAELDYAIGDEWRDVCEPARAALARYDKAREESR